MNQNQSDGGSGWFLRSPGICIFYRFQPFAAVLAKRPAAVIDKPSPVERRRYAAGKNAPFVKAVQR